MSAVDVYPAPVTISGRGRVGWAAFTLGVLGLVLGLAVHSLAALSERPNVTVTFADVSLGEVAVAAPSMVGRAPSTGLTVLRGAGQAVESVVCRAGGRAQQDGNGTLCPSAFLALMLLTGLAIAMAVARRRAGPADARRQGPCADRGHSDDRSWGLVRLCVLRT